MEGDQLFKVVDLRHLLFQDRPLALHDCNHDIFIDGAEEVLHLLPEELKLAKFAELNS